MNRDYEEIDRATDNLAEILNNLDIDMSECLIYMDAVMAASKRMADRILQLENALDEANRQLEEVLKAAVK